MESNLPWGGEEHGEGTTVEGIDQVEEDSTGENHDAIRDPIAIPVPDQSTGQEDAQWHQENGAKQRDPGQQGEWFQEHAYIHYLDLC